MNSPTSPKQSTPAHVQEPCTELRTHRTPPNDEGCCLEPVFDLLALPKSMVEVHIWRLLGRDDRESLRLTSRAYHAWACGLQQHLCVRVSAVKWRCERKLHVVFPEVRQLHIVHVAPLNKASLNLPTSHIKQVLATLGVCSTVETLCLEGWLELDQFDLGKLALAYPHYRPST
jgi:hypothetical protein